MRRIGTRAWNNQISPPTSGQLDSRRQYSVIVTIDALICLDLHRHSCIFATDCWPFVAWGHLRKDGHSVEAVLVPQVPWHRPSFDLGRNMRVGGPGIT